MTSDYPDWLNPMLVKELRQGLSKGMFTGVFVLVQVVMILFLGVRLLTADADVDQYLGGFMDGVLKTGLGMIVLLMLPARGLAAIQEEKKIQTLELVQMTRLNSQRIVWGKWVAIMSQILLFTVAVMPYGVLRYFLGGMEILDTLVSLGGMLLMSMTATAFCIWLSTMGAGVRGLAVLFLVIGFQFATIRVMGLGSSFSLFPNDALAGIFSAIVSTVFLLTMASSRIASVAENHAVILRGIALVAGMVALAGTVLSGPQWAYVGVPVMVWSIFLALTEMTSEVPSMYAPWLRSGLPGRVACRIMNPGWASGLIFSAAVVAIMGLCDYLAFMTKERDLMSAALVYAMCYLALVVPLVVMPVSLAVKHRGIVYLCFHAVCVLIMMIGSATFSASGFALDSVTPTGAALWMLSHRASPRDEHWLMGGVAALPIGLLCLLFLLCRSIREFKLMSKQEAKVTSAKAFS
ncbi:MAG: hypothetical protein JWO08_4337 [Verrucomicrobiaceae bacterium]|nr:hypothetical protein [Verrucomicrobiaceae bacterium]